MRASSYFDKGYTRVIFRVFTGKAGGDVIALFPDLPGNRTAGSCLCYQHVGQHGHADLATVLRQTRPATIPERLPLRRELSGEPYKYKLVERERYVQLKGRRG